LWISLAVIASAQQPGPAPSAEIKPAAQQKPAQKAAPEEGDREEPLIVLVYNVTDLVLVIPSYHFRGTQVPGVSIGGYPYYGQYGYGIGPAGGGMGGGSGSGGMGGSGSGGGMGSSGGGGGMGGMGGGMFNTQENPGQADPLPPRAGVKPPQRPPIERSRAGTPATHLVPQSVGAGFDFDTLIEAIQSTIEPESWENTGGRGSIAPLGGMLVISQTAAIHKKIETLLRDLREASDGQQTVTVRATWLFLDTKQVNQLTRGQTKGGIDRAALDDLAAKVKGYQGQISCFDGQTVHVVSGRCRSVVLSAIPVVGSEPGYQPIVSTPQIGVLLQVTPQLLPKARAAVLDVQSFVTRTDEAPAPFPFLSSQTIGGKTEEGKPAPARQQTLSLDRVNLVAHQLATTLRVPLGSPVLVGGLTLEPGAAAQEGAGGPQLYLFVEVTAK
jgi:hypothetical protein